MFCIVSINTSLQTGPQCRERANQQRLCDCPKARENTRNNKNQWFPAVSLSAFFCRLQPFCARRYIILRYCIAAVDDYVLSCNERLSNLLNRKQVVALYYNLYSHNFGLYPHSHTKYDIRNKVQSYPIYEVDS